MAPFSRATSQPPYCLVTALDTSKREEIVTCPHWNRTQILDVHLPSLPQILFLVSTSVILLIFVLFLGHAYDQSTHFTPKEVC